MEFFLENCKSSNYSRQPDLACFKISGKFLRQRVVWSSFLQKQALTGPLQNSCSREFFGKIIPGRTASALKKNSTLDVSLKSMQSMQTILEQLF